MKFDQLDADWFRRAGAADPEGAALEWRRWRNARSRTDNACHVKVLELATIKSRAAATFYVSGKNTDKLSQDLIARFDEVSAALGSTRRLAEERDAGERLPRSRSSRIAILTELAGVPSPSYHLEMLSACYREVTQRNLLCALHELRPRQLYEDVERLARLFRPGGAITVRLSPDQRVTDKLKTALIPTVLIHADRLTYGAPPILANVVPEQQSIADGIRLWARGLPPSQSPVVVVAMPPGDPKSIRHERIEMVRSGLDGCKKVKVEEVADYSFRHAARLAKKFRSARGFVCLSDELAVALKQALEAAGRPTQGRIVGYDNSKLAESGCVSSFGQHIGDTARSAVEELVKFMRNPPSAEEQWPRFREIPIPVTWVPRE